MINSDVLHIPVGDICENRCIFCMESSRLKEPTEREVRNILEEKNHMKKVMFTSGEPLLNRNIVKFMRMAKDLGYEEIGVTTNGRRFSDKAFLKDAISAGLNRITVSFHGHNKRIHESLTRSAGSFEDAHKAIKNISGLKKSNRIVFNINVILTKLNYKHIDKIYKLVSAYNIDEINFRIAEPRGFAKEVFGAVVPRYYDVCKEFYRYDWPGRKKHVTLTGIPLCISHRLNIALGSEARIHMRFGKKYILHAPKDREMLESCKKCRFCNACDGIWTEYLKHYGRKEFEPVPDIKKDTDAPKIRDYTKRSAGYIQLTRKCNRMCVFCSNPYVNDSMSFKDIMKQIDCYINMGVNEIIFTGGEPTLNSNIFRAIEYCRNMTLGCRIITNGTKLADERYAKKLAYSGLRDVNISLYSHKKDIQDMLTQTKGSYEKAMLAIKNTLKHINIPIINITINKSNAEDLDETIIFILKKFPDIRHFVFNNMDPTGRALKNKWTVPRLTDMELGLQRALSYLSLAGKTFRVERVPLCYMQNFEEFSTETRKIIKNEMYRCLFLNRNKRELREVVKFYYKKAPCCEVCSLNDICAGLNPRYVRLFGLDELFPVFENKNEIIRKVKNG